MIVAATRRTEKTVEIHQSYIIRPASGSLPALCVDGLTGDAFMVAREQVAMVTHIPLQTIDCRVETRLIHYQEGRDAGNPVKEM
jgi:hypothetical protein